MFYGSNTVAPRQPSTNARVQGSEPKVQSAKFRAQSSELPLHRRSAGADERRGGFLEDDFLGPAREHTGGVDQVGQVHGDGGGRALFEELGRVEADIAALGAQERAEGGGDHLAAGESPRHGGSSTGRPGALVDGPLGHTAEELGQQHIAQVGGRRCWGVRVMLERPHDETNAPSRS